MYNKLPEYNGYTNKPTWLISLWIDNEPGDYDYWLERCQLVLQDKKSEDQELVHHIAEALQYHFEDQHYPLDNASVYTDLLTFALAYVNWYEVAEGLIETAKEQ